MSWFIKIKSKLIRLKDPLIDQLITKGLTYLKATDLLEMQEALLDLKSKNLNGIYLEAGVALGGSAIFTCKFKRKETEFLLYDVYDMIPAPSTEDGNDVHERYAVIKSGKSTGIQGNKYYGYEDNLIQKVMTNFQRLGHDIEENNVKFIKGKFQNTMDFKNELIAFAHIDCDWYDSVKFCLEKIHPNLEKGGLLLIDDYFHYSGCRKAVDEFLLIHKNSYERVERAKLHLIKK